MMIMMIMMIMSYMASTLPDDQADYDDNHAHYDHDIHSENQNIGGAIFSAQKNWREKCVNCNNKILQSMYVNHEHSINFVIRLHISLNS